MDGLPKFAWHELLSPIAPAKLPAESAARLYARGKEVHRRLESIVGDVHLVEQEGTFWEPGLPFEILFHPDVIRQEIDTRGTIETFVYEIKPLVWFLKNRTYCSAQLAGYQHFTGAAEADFILYWTIGSELALSIFPGPHIQWNQLRDVALRGYEILIRSVKE